MATFILVHGAWMGAWVWSDIANLLQASGHKVIVPDLPGSGKSVTALEQVNFSNYLACLSKIINQQTEKVILVAHSMAGMVISQIAEIMPNKILSLVYLCAFLPKTGESILDIVEKFQVNSKIAYDFCSYSCTVRNELIDELFFNCCAKKYREFAKALMRPHATKIFRKKLKLTDNNFGLVAKIYIKCTKDNIINLDMQNIMASRQLVNQVYSIATDHCPFFQAK